MKNGFKKNGLSPSDLLILIEHQEIIKNFLLDIQTDYRIQRAMGVDEGDAKLHGTYAIDDILSRFKHIHEANDAYVAKMREIEEKKINEQIEK